MRRSLVAFAFAAGLLPWSAASACPPPPPGYVPPTHEQFLQRSLSDTTDIVYGVLTEAGLPGQPSKFKIIHVYKGAARKGDTIQAPVGWGHPMPVCAGMMGHAPSRPVGAYGVIAYRDTAPELNFIKPDDVQIMIKQGWIRSARAR